MVDKIKMILLFVTVMLILTVILMEYLKQTDTAIGKWLSVTFRPHLRSDNLNDTLKLNRFISNPFILGLMIILADLALFIAFTTAVNIIREIPDMIKYHDSYKFYMAGKMLPQMKEYSSFTKGTFVIFAIFLFIVSIRMAYMTRLSYSEKAINKGNSGTSRWTTLKEITRQYKEIEMYPVNEEGETNFFEGKGGMPISRWRDKFYIDSQLTNNLFLGATRSGKGEMFVFPLIDILSRAREQINRPSVIIFDPKLELYKSSFETLQKRGYRVRLLNLDNPIKSAGYNPLQIMADFWKKGRVDEAKQLARSFSFGIFNSSADTQEPIWKNTSTDLWTAMIVAHISDCLEADDILNHKRGIRFKNLRKTFTDYATSSEATEEEINKRIEGFANIYLRLKDGEDYLNRTFCSMYDEWGIPEVIPAAIVKKVLGEDSKEEIRDIRLEWKEINPNEKNINCFSVLNFFKELVDTTSASFGDDQAGAKKAETALDDYFNARPPLDYAKALYASIKSAGDKTKGSVYINMQSALSIFTMDNIARLTAESDIDIASLGFDKEAPTAVFLGLPTEDKANHFLAMTFVTQVFQYLWKLSKEGNNKLDREVQFILDEFGNMPVFDNFDGMVTNCLGAGMAFNIFIQSYNQLHSKYEMDMDTIKDNFANQFYILAVGKESAEEFSEQLGNKTIVELQRSGTLLSMKKSILENNKDRPLLFAHELQRLREGETALIRAAKRTEKSGAGIESFPILDEYQDNIYPWTYVRIFFDKIIKKRLIKNERMKDRDTGEELNFFQEYRYWISYEKRYEGTAFLYRWQYAQAAFPNPTEINFMQVFKEKGRDTVDYMARVMDVDAVKEKLGIAVEQKMAKYSVKRLLDLEEGQRAKFYRYCYSNLGVDFADKIQITEKMPVKDISKKIAEYIGTLPEEEKFKLNSIDFMNNLKSVLFQQ